MVSLSFSHFAHTNHVLHFHAVIVGVAIAFLSEPQEQVVAVSNSLLLSLAHSQSALSGADSIHDIYPHTDRIPRRLNTFW